MNRQSVELRPIAEIIERLIDYRGNTPRKSEDGVRLVTAKVIKGGRIREEPAEYIASDTYDAWMRRGLPRQLDVLITTEAPLGEVAILRSDARIALAQRVILLRPDLRVLDPWYFYYALQSPQAQAALRARSSGTTVAGIKQTELLRVLIPVHSRATQTRIGALLSKIDDLIENNLRRIRILEDMVRAIYREWFVHFRFPGHEGVAMVESTDGLIPAGWRVMPLGRIAIEARRNVDKGPLETAQPVVGLEHIPRRSLALDAWDIASEIGSNKLAFRQGEVLFGKIRPYFHKVSIAPFDGLCSADTIVLAPAAPELYGLLVLTVSSDEFVAHATATSNGAKMPRASWAVLSEWPLALPSRALCRTFTELVAPMFSMQQALVLQNVNLRTTRDLLLPRLMSGQLTLTEAEAAV